MARLLSSALVAGFTIALATAQTSHTSFTPCFDDNGPVACTSRLVASADKAAGFSLGGNTGTGATFNGGVIVTTTTAAPAVTAKPAITTAIASGSGSDVTDAPVTNAPVTEAPTEEASNPCADLIPSDANSQMACHLLAFGGNPECCTCEDVLSTGVDVSTGFMAWSYVSNCTEEAVDKIVANEDEVGFAADTKNTVGACINDVDQCCEDTDFTMTIKTNSGEEEVKVCTQVKTEDCGCAPASTGVTVEPECEDNATVTIIIVIFSIIVFIVLALAVYFMIVKDDEGTEAPTKLSM